LPLVDLVERVLLDAAEFLVGELEEFLGSVRRCAFSSRSADERSENWTRDLERETTHPTSAPPMNVRLAMRAISASNYRCSRRCFPVLMVASSVLRADCGRRPSPAVDEFNGQAFGTATGRLRLPKIVDGLRF
jgi:hypothetical protein